MSIILDKKNVIIHNSDNIEVLKHLESNSIDLIYCDIPYNSGKEFKTYSDKLGTVKEAIEWFRPRFEEMHRVLSMTGSIYIQCNWNLDSYVRVFLLDEIFGMENFRNRITRKHCELRDFKDNYDSQVDTIFFYTKSDSYTFNKERLEKAKLVPLFENGIKTGRDYVIYHVGQTVSLADKRKHWVVSEAVLTEIQLRGNLFVLDGLPYRKSYTKAIGNLWDSEDMLDDYSRHNLDSEYDTPKPPSILTRIISVSSNVGDTVADFFCGGSGATAVEAYKAGRNAIVCDISPTACELTKVAVEREISKL